MSQIVARIFRNIASFVLPFAPPRCPSCLQMHPPLSFAPVRDIVSAHLHATYDMS